MTKTILVIAAIATCDVCFSQVVSPDFSCGKEIPRQDVLLVDLSDVYDTTTAVDFLRSKVPNYQMPNFEHIPIGRFSSTTTALIRIAAKRGCNLVVLLGINTESTGRFVHHTDSNTGAVKSSREVFQRVAFAGIGSQN